MRVEFIVLVFASCFGQEIGKLKLTTGRLFLSLCFSVYNEILIHPRIIDPSNGLEIQGSLTDVSRLLDL
jgi:hypothetical protein